MTPMKVRLGCPDGCGVIAESNDPDMTAGHRCRRTGRWTALVRVVPTRKGKA